MYYSYTLLLIVCSIYLVSAKTSGVPEKCNFTYECAIDASVNYNYVNCINHTCTCLTANGFSGNGSSANPCRCNYTVYWGNSQPFCKNCQPPSQIIYDQAGNPKCVNVDQCEDSTVQGDHQKAVVMKIYTNLLEPMASAILANPSLVDDVFSPNISGRITPVGIFNDLEGTIEYFYALAVSGNVIKVYFIDLISENNTVSVRVDIKFNSSGFIYNLTQTGFFHFDASGRVFEYDLSILRLGQVEDPLVANHTANINQICGAHQYYCTGPNQQYTDFGACVSFLNSIPYGTFYNAMSNTVVCRIIHTILVPYRPAIHCPHIGPTGGMTCVDFSYESFYAEPYY